MDQPIAKMDSSIRKIGTDLQKNIFRIFTYGTAVNHRLRQRVYLKK